MCIKFLSFLTLASFHIKPGAVQILVSNKSQCLTLHTAAEPSLLNKIFTRCLFIFLWLGPIQVSTGIQSAAGMLFAGSGEGSLSFPLTVPSGGNGFRDAFESGLCMGQKEVNNQYKAAFCTCQR